MQRAPSQPRVPPAAQVEEQPQILTEGQLRAIEKIAGDVLKKHHIVNLPSLRGVFQESSDLDAQGASRLRDKVLHTGEFDGTCRYR